MYSRLTLLVYFSSYRYSQDSVGPVHQNQQQIRLNIHTCTTQRCYYRHDWLHKHLGTGIRLNLKRLQRKLCVTQDEATVYGAVNRTHHTTIFCIFLKPNNNNHYYCYYYHNIQIYLTRVTFDIISTGEIVALMINAKPT